jgi:outer membrane protein assembly factor BamA
MGKLPLVPTPTPQPFSPLLLQQDVARLRRAYRAAGFPHAEVHYDVRRDDAKNLLDITFVVTEGQPLVLTDVMIVPEDSLVPLPVAASDRRSWSHLEHAVLKQRGDRLDVNESRQNRQRLARWWQDRGYPRAIVNTRFAVDSTTLHGRLAYRVAPGMLARFGDVRVEGNTSIRAESVRRRQGSTQGDRYSEQAIEQAEMSLRDLDIVRVAKVDVPALAPPDSTTLSLPLPPPDTSVAAVASNVPLPPPPPDSILPVRVRITEAEPRLVSGDLGYVTDAGISSEARWSHRNFSGGGRSLTLTGLAQTGWLAVASNPDIRYRLALSLKQPGFPLWNMTTALTPFIEHRDDSQDRSTQYGLNSTFVWKARRVQTVSLDYQIARRHVYEYNFEDLATGEIDLLTFLTHVAQGQLSEVGTDLSTSTFTLAGSAQRLDDAANPHRGAIIRPSIQVTAPQPWSSTSYWRVGATGNGFLPMGRRSVFAVRLGAGWLTPFGKSVPGPGDDPQVKFLQLRDQLFTAGGTADARGWEDRLLGPKVPDIRFSTVGDSLVPRAEGYVPLGGFARFSFSSELRLPLPGFGPNFGSQIFFDGGRVWSDDARFGMSADPYGQEKLFVGTGAGLSVRTPVGPIAMSMGYKLNPSVVDLIDANDLLQAVNAGRPIDQLKQHNGRRWQFHLAIGTSY